MANYRTPNEAQLLGAWRVPLRGVLANKPINEIPDDGLYRGDNVTVRGGSLRPRPGMTQFASTVLTGRPTGIFNTSTLAAGAFQADAFQNDAFQVTGSIPTTTTLVGTTKKIYLFLSGSFVDITGSPDLTALDHELAQFTSIQLGTPANIFIIHTNGRDNPRQWDSVSGSFTAVAGTPPLWTDVTNIGDHIIGIVPPYDVRWGNNLSLATWPALNIKSLSETADPLIAIMNLGLLGGAIYKQRTIWSVTAQGGTEASFYRFEYRGSFDGPASSAALVDADGIHFYMTDTGRVGAFDGFQHNWVADGVWPVTQSLLDTANSNRIHGAYDSENFEVNFYYPRTGDSGECKGMVTIILPRLRDGIMDPIGFTGTMGKAVSASTGMRMDIKRIMVATPVTPKAYTVDGSNDDGVEISGSWQPGLGEMPGKVPHRVEAIEVFAERGGGYGTLNINAVYSNLLESPGGSLGGTIGMSLATASGKPSDPFGTDVRGRFLGLKFSFTTPVTLRYRGAQMTGFPLERGKLTS